MAATRRGVNTGPFKAPRAAADRLRYIVRACVDRRVLHLGCADFVSDGKWFDRTTTRDWLHSHISEVASDTIGIDNQPHAVSLVRDQLGWTNVYFGDAQKLDQLQFGTFDVVVAGEIIEHLPAPGELWRSARSVLRPGGSLIVSTANAYCARRFIRMLFGSESVHIDHVAYFSHRTLNRLAEMYNYRVTEQLSYPLGNTRPYLPYAIEKLVCTVFPQL
ncbi:MAG: class I SAM-dependent methyltransferase, partial [Rhodopirellula sp.]|nr:class I SAM-dependent methyltransferase [Rhodopirellula sp.]